MGSPPWIIERDLRFFLTLLALLTGFAGADRAMAAPTPAVALGSVIMMAEAAAQAGDADKGKHPTETTPSRRASAPCRKPMTSSAPHLPGILTRSDRALE